MIEHSLRARQLVININQDDQIERRERQMGVRLRAEDSFDICNFALSSVLPKTVEHGGLNIVRENLAVGSNQLGHAKTVEAGSCADVADKHTGLEMQGSKSLFGLFFPFAFFSIQPVCAAHSHDGRDAATRCRMHRLSLCQSRAGQQAQDQQGNSRRHPTRSGLVHLIVFLLSCTFLFLPDAFAQNNDASVSIINAGVQSSEDGPFVSSGHRFLPGDPVHATFQVSGFRSQKQNEDAARTMSVHYSAVLEDANAIPMAPPETGAVDTELSSEDKDWTPKRRVVFTIPSYVAAGKAQLHLIVEDVLGKSRVERSLPLTIGGVTVLEAQKLAVQNGQFFRTESSNEPLELPAFAPGDSVFLRFDMTGFKYGENNSYRLTYDLLVTRPDGKTYLRQLHAAELSASSFYPAQFLPGTVQVTTSRDSGKGKYALTLTIHDEVGKTSIETKAFFTLE